MTSDLNKCNVVDIASLRASIINQLHPVSIADLTTIPSVPLDTVNDGQWSSSQMLGDTEIKEMPVCVSPEKSSIDCDVDVGGNTGNCDEFCGLTHQNSECRVRNPDVWLTVWIMHTERFC